MATEDRQSAMAADWQAIQANKAAPAVAMPAVANEPVVSSSNELPGAPEGSVLHAGPTSIWDEALKADSAGDEVEAEDGGEEFTPPTPLEAQGRKTTGYQRLKQQNVELQEMAHEMRSQIDQVAPALQELRQQNAMLAQQLREIASGRGQAPQQPQVDPNDPFVRLTQELKPEFQRELDPVMQRIQQLEQQNQTLQQERADHAEKQKRDQKRSQYTNETQAALGSVLFKDAPVEDSQVKDVFAKAVTLLALAEKTTPEEAARKIKRSMLSWSQKFHSNALAAQKMKAGAAVSRPAPESTTRAEGQPPAPSAEALKTSVAADGRRFSTILQWRMANSPQLFKR